MDRTGRIREYLLLPILAASGAACSGPAIMSGGADADTDANVDEVADAGPLSGGVALRFLTSPGLDDGLQVEGASFDLGEVQVDLSDLRLIGDAATGDDRTRIDLVKLRWDDESSTGVRSAAYPDAPPGLYSLVRGAITQFEIEVNVEPDSGEAFTIEIDFEESPLAIDFALNSTLEVGMALEVDVVLNLASVLTAIDLETLEIDEEENSAEIEGEDLDELAEIFAQSFTVQSVR